MYPLTDMSISEAHKNVLDEIYYSTTGSAGAFSSLRPLYTEAKRRDKSISISVVRKYLFANNAYLLHRRVLRRYPKRSLLVFAPNDIWCLDYAVYIRDKGSNQNRIYSLNCIDAFSHKSYARAGTRKSAEQTLHNFKDIIKSAKCLPKHLFTDQGMSTYVNTKSNKGRIVIA